MATVRRFVGRTVAGAAAAGAFGYYLGAKAGRSRYEAINRVVTKAGGTGPGTAVKKARALADLSLETARGAAARLPGPLRSSRARPPEAGGQPAD